MRIPRIFTAAMPASALAQAEPLSPQVAERYRQMLAANPSKGIALERLWNGALDGGTDRRRAELRRGEFLQLALESAHRRAGGGNNHDRVIGHDALLQLD